MKNKIIIFDLDGVLFDSTKLVNDFFLSTYPTMTKEILDEMLVGNFHDELDKVKLVHKPINETPEEYKIRSDAYSLKKSQSLLYDGIKDLLGTLHTNGYILIVNTSALEKNCLPLLEYANIGKYFSFVATKEVSRSKVEKFKIIEEKFNSPKERTLFITDTLGDIREADAAQIPTIAVTWGAHDRTYFTREHHNNLIAVVDSVDELETHIKNY